MARLDLTGRQLRITRNAILNKIVELRKHLADMEVLYEGKRNQDIVFAYQKFILELEEIESLLLPVVREENKKEFGG